MTSTHEVIVPINTVAVPNGSGAAAILSAGIGSFAVALTSIAADKSAVLKNLFSIYKPAGPLSGETTLAILVWLLAWGFFELRWRRQALTLSRVNAIAFGLLGLSLLCTFPPIADLF
jgi:asparagine N-glycosylation enzyme membrane subunit Stt3